MNFKYFLPYKDINKEENKYIVILKNLLFYILKSPLRFFSKKLSYNNANKILGYALNNQVFVDIKKTKKFDDRVDLWKDSVKFNNLENKKIAFLEFGVQNGESFKEFSNLFKSKKTLLYGFDTFTGMPENWHKIKKGTWSTNGKVPNIKDRRSTFVKGIFQKTLPKYISHFKKLKKLNYEFYIHNDSDLYSSTLFVLNQFKQDVYFKVVFLEI